MQRFSLKEMARFTGINLFRLIEMAERGETVRNIDLSKYAVRDQRGEVEAVEVPDRLAPNLRPGSISQSSAAEAFEAGREAERREQSESQTETVESGDGGWETIVVEKRPDTVPVRQNNAETKASGIGRLLAMIGLAGASEARRREYEDADPTKRLREQVKSFFR